MLLDNDDDDAENFDSSDEENVNSVDDSLVKHHIVYTFDEDEAFRNISWMGTIVNIDNEDGDCGGGAVAAAAAADDGHDPLVKFQYHANVLTDSVPFHIVVRKSMCIFEYLFCRLMKRELRNDIKSVTSMDNLEFVVNAKSNFKDYNCRFILCNNNNRLVKNTSEYTFSTFFGSFRDTIQTVEKDRKKMQFNSLRFCMESPIFYKYSTHDNRQHPFPLRLQSQKNIVTVSNNSNSSQLKRIYVFKNGAFKEIITNLNLKVNFTPCFSLFNIMCNDNKNKSTWTSVRYLGGVICDNE